MKQELKTVYIPVNGETELGVCYFSRFEEWTLNEGVEKQQLITFTPEEYNQHLKNILSFLDLHTDEAPISYIKREFIKQFPKYE